MVTQVATICSLHNVGEDRHRVEKNQRDTLLEISTRFNNHLDDGDFPTAYALLLSDGGGVAAARCRLTLSVLSLTR